MAVDLVGGTARHSDPGQGVRATYGDLTLWTLEMYYDGIDHLEWTPQPSVAAALDDSTTGWAKQPLQCVAAVLTLSIVSLREGFWPDYLQAMWSRLRDVSDSLDVDDRLRYRSDVATLETLLRHVPYQVIATGASFMRDVDHLLPPSVVRWTANTVVVGRPGLEPGTKGL